MEKPESQLDGNTQYLLRKFETFEQAHDLTVGQLTSRISFLEKRIRDVEAKHGALVAAVYAKKEAQNAK